MTDLSIKFSDGISSMGIQIIIEFSNEISRRTLDEFLLRTNRTDLIPAFKISGPLLLGHIDEYDRNRIILSVNVPQIDLNLRKVLMQCLDDTVEKACEILCLTGNDDVKMNGADISFHDTLKCLGADRHLLICFNGKELEYNPYRDIGHR